MGHLQSAEYENSLPLSSWQFDPKAFTKLIASLYGVVSLTLMLRVQVNVVARYLFLESLLKQEQGTTDVRLPFNFIIWKF